MSKLISTSLKGNKHISRVYINQKLFLGQIIILNEDDSLHLIKVLRLDKGSYIKIFNELYGEWLSIINDPNKSRTEIKVIENIKKPTCDQKKINLFITPLKKEPMKFLIEKVTELGVHSITQVITDLSNNKPLLLDKIQSKVKQASEQCERLSLPVVYPTINLSCLLQTIINSNKLVWLNEHKLGASLHSILANKNNAIINILIGPEGGFSTHEHTILKSHPDVINTFFPGNILKSETAAITAVALSNYL